MAQWSNNRSPAAASGGEDEEGREPMAPDDVDGVASEEPIRVLVRVRPTSGASTLVVEPPDGIRVPRGRSGEVRARNELFVFIELF